MNILKIGIVFFFFFFEWVVGKLFIFDEAILLKTKEEGESMNKLKYNLIHTNAADLNQKVEEN